MCPGDKHHGCYKRNIEPTHCVSLHAPALFRLLSTQTEIHIHEFQKFIEQSYAVYALVSGFFHSSMVLKFIHVHGVSQ